MSERRALLMAHVDRIYEDVIRLARYGVERVERDWRNPDKAAGAREMAEEIVEALEAYRDQDKARLALPPLPTPNVLDAENVDV